MSLTRDAYNNDYPNQPWSEKCACGKRFMQPNSYALHVGCCTVFKKRLGRNLQEARHRHRVAFDGTSKSQPVANLAEQGGSLPRKRVRPSWLAEEELEVDLVKRVAATTAQPDPPLQDEVPEHTLHTTSLANDNCDEELGRGRRKKELSYKIRRAANVKPSCPSALPTSLYSSVLQPIPEASTTHGLQPLVPSLHSKSSTLANGSVPHEPKLQCTRPNAFGLYKSYQLYSDDVPHDPDASYSPSDLQEDCASVSLVKQPVQQEPQCNPSSKTSGTSAEPSLYPFPNASAFQLGEWFWSDDHEKSQRSFQNLLNIVGSDTFKPADVRNINWRQINENLAASQYEDDCPSELIDDGGVSWRTVPTTIMVPISKSSEKPGSYPFTVPGFYFRPLVPVIKEKLESSAHQEHFHTLGSELRWKPGEQKEDVRVHGEMYHSAAFLEAYEELQKTPREPGCDLPRHVIGLMFASDATMLASFGSAKTWPCYLFFGNDSKYKRAKPSEKLFETVAFFEKLPDDFKDFITQFTGKSAVNQTLLTHCQRELFHAQWKHMLDSEFVEAYCHGIVVTCYDGIARRFYPRIFTYSADYPEKILIASIKNLGLFPCPRCKVAMKDVPAMGKVRDQSTRVRWARVDDDNRRKRVADAQNYIYNDHLSLASTFVEARMDDGSLVPTANAFSERLAQMGFNLFRMLVIDVMHEVELGVWKAVFIQLLRLLEAVQKGLMNVLDARYRNMPTFGRDTIRRFINNVSEMKQLAARDFEDLLQCAIPAFEGLLPYPHNERVTKLLYTFGRWHGFAKLRMHTDHTLKILDELTVQLGEEVRVFVKKTCSAFETKELAREYQARKRQEARKAAATSELAPAPLSLQANPTTVQGGGAEGASNAALQASCATIALDADMPDPQPVPAPALGQTMLSSNALATPNPLEKRTSASTEVQSKTRVATEGIPTGHRVSDAAGAPSDGVETGQKRKADHTFATRASKRLRAAQEAAQGSSLQSLRPESPKKSKRTGRRGKAASTAEDQPPPTHKYSNNAPTEADLPDGQVESTSSIPLSQRLDSGQGLPATVPDVPKGRKTRRRKVCFTATKRTIKGRKTGLQEVSDIPEQSVSGDSGGHAGVKRARKSTSTTGAPKRQKVDERPAQSQEKAPDTIEDPDNEDKSEAGDRRRIKTLNLNTYKWHALGDVVPAIRLFGTTDSYSTQIPERFHRYPKMHYKRTSKRNVSRQFSRIQTRQARIRKLRKQLVPEQSEDYREDSDKVPPYFIGKSQNHPVELPVFVQTKKHDPAVKDFVPKLKAHLLPRIYRRLLEEEEASEDRDEQCIQLLGSLVSETNRSTDQSDSATQSTTSPDVDRILIHSDRIYHHNILHINYTSYDVRRETDIVNPKTSRRDIMCLRDTQDMEAEEGSVADVHRFMHARVLGVYHVNVVYRGRGAADLRKHRFDFLWVRWYSFCEEKPAANSFDRLKLGKVSDPTSVGFLDPADVLRACHIIPRYTLGQLYGSDAKDRIQSKLAKDHEDWCEYYANRFVDRDMLMRYTWGHGVGHTYSHGDAPNAITISSSPTLHEIAPEVEATPRGLDQDQKLDQGEENRVSMEDLAGAAVDTLDNLEEEELAVVDPEEDDEEPYFEEQEIQEPDSEIDDAD